MRYIQTLLFVLCMSVIMQSYAAVGEGKLDITITGVKNNNGVIRIALYNSQQTYNMPGVPGQYAFRKAAPSIQNNQAHWVFTHLPYGDYAIRVFHDAKLNNKLPRGPLGKPTVGYGFSNNPSTTFGEPSYLDTKFIFNTKYLPVYIKIQ